MIKRIEIQARSIEDGMGIMLTVRGKGSLRTTSVWCDVVRVNRFHRSVTVYARNKVNGSLHISRFDNNDTVGVWVKA
jgi:hypothetical protein